MRVNVTQLLGRSGQNRLQNVGQRIDELVRLHHEMHIAV